MFLRFTLLSTNSSVFLTKKPLLIVTFLLQNLFTPFNVKILSHSFTQHYYTLPLKKKKKKTLPLIKFKLFDNVQSLPEVKGRILPEKVSNSLIKFFVMVRKRHSEGNIITIYCLFLTNILFLRLGKKVSSSIKSANFTETWQAWGFPLVSLINKVYCKNHKHFHFQFIIKQKKWGNGAWGSRLPSAALCVWVNVWFVGFCLHSFWEWEHCDLVSYGYGGPELGTGQH